MITIEELKEIEEDNKKRIERLTTHYKRFNYDDAPILKRTFDQSTKINNKLPHDWAGYIAKTKVGYYLGNGIGVSSDLEDEEQAKDHLKDIKRWKRLNSFDELLQDIGLIIEACGEAATLSYLEDGVLRVRGIQPYNVLYSKEYTILYYSTKENTKKYIVYDDTDKTTFEKNEESFYKTGSVPHMIGHNPIVRWKANKEMNSCIKSVEPLIDDLDRLESDLSSELEEFRLAYIVSKGATFEEDDVKRMRQTGMLEVGENDDLFFITKKIEIEAILSKIKKREADITRFAETFDSVSDRAGLSYSSVA